MFQEIIQARSEQLDWAKRAAGHMLKLDKYQLGIPDEKGYLEAFREAIGSEHGPMIVSAAMDCLAGVITRVLLPIHEPTTTPLYVRLKLSPELEGSVHYVHEVVESRTAFNGVALFEEIEVRFGLFNGRGALFDGLEQVLRESPPITWGLIEFERLPGDSNALKAQLSDRYYNSDPYFPVS
jgi:hypothetical protein